MCEAIVLDKMCGLGAFARARTAEDVDDGYFFGIEGGCGVVGGCGSGGLEGWVCAGCRVYGRHVGEL